MAHYLPPISFGGCEDLTITLARKYGGVLYCPRYRCEKPPGFMSGSPTYRNIYERRGISKDRVFFREDAHRLLGVIDTLFIVGIYWPNIIDLGLRTMRRIRRIVMLPLYHVRDGQDRIQQLKRVGVFTRVSELVTFSKVEANYVMSRAGCLAHVTIAPHLAGICVHNEKDLPAPEDSGYVLFPSRASKGVDVARGVAAKLGLPLAGNQSYCVGNQVDLQVNFDACNPYKGAKLVVSVTRHDSYNIGIAKAMDQGVPAAWDDGNEQIRGIWSEFPSAIPLHRFDGAESVRQAQSAAEASRALLRRRIEESVGLFSKVV